MARREQRATAGTSATAVRHRCSRKVTENARATETTSPIRIGNRTIMSRTAGAATTTTTDLVLIRTPVNATGTTAMSVKLGRAAIIILSFWLTSGGTAGSTAGRTGMTVVVRAAARTSTMNGNIAELGLSAICGRIIARGTTATTTDDNLIVARSHVNIPKDQDTATAAAATTASAATAAATDNQ